ncbi:MAG: hypothetical protein KIT68_10380 [Phycisphaeraceae bacterium]|nr:hypothetical protein [Phycisphaeraceae bacterium]
MNSIGSRARARGFTLVEAAAVVAVTVCVGAAAVVGAGSGQPLDPLTKARQNARQVKDATQIRGIVQAMMIWAQNNREAYPLPSQVDKADATVAEKGRAKDTTANILSLLIFNGSISPEMCVSPLENNPKIKAHGGYELDRPKAAARPIEALWDPSFNADFAGDRAAHNSFAHLQPSGELNGAKPMESSGRLARWGNTFVAIEPVVSTRGARIKSVRIDGEDAWPEFDNQNSNAFSFYKPGGAWSGNVAFNDGRVDFLDRYLAPGAVVKTAARYKTREGASRPDMAFFDEPDDAAGANNFLGIFTKAGVKPSEFTSIWD